MYNVKFTCSVQTSCLLISKDERFLAPDVNDPTRDGSLCSLNAVQRSEYAWKFVLVRRALLSFPSVLDRQPIRVSISVNTLCDRK